MAKRGAIAWLVFAVLAPAAGAWDATAREGARYAQSWEQLTPEQRERALQNFQRYQRLPESSRSRIQRRYERFQGLPPGEQEKLRRNYDAYRSMTPRQRQELNERLRRWQGGRP